MKKIVLITGCSSGIGLLTALKFAREGYTVYASVKSFGDESVSRLRDQVQEQSLSIKIIEIDVAESESVEKGIDLIQNEEGKIDILINNAGFGYMGPIEAFDLEEVKEQYETNVFGALRMIKTVVPIMRTQKSGLIINVGSINGLLAFPYYGIYSSTKYSVESLTESLRFELGKFGIKVALVEPGTFFTDFTLNRKFPKSLGDENSPYKNQVLKFFRKLDQLEESGKNNNFVSKLGNPQNVANLIYKISNEKNPRLHNRIGLDAHIYYYARKVLPDFIWQFILRRVYN